MRIYCIFSQEAIDLMGGNRGKLAAQAGHAYLHSFWEAQENFPDLAKAYRRGLARKICMVVPTTQDLVRLNEMYENYPKSLVTDSGFTVFDGPTITCLGIGPVPQMEIPGAKLLV